ncbi:MAG TPA: ATP-binding protein [Candidatus Saccharimonadales bacterium]|jgi:signal transduction histidine kinase|nr:ATP-binding protein [Candidatus Saccharimonadales bacterium]
MAGEGRATPRWLDLIWLLFLACLAALPPQKEWHKQIILGLIGLFQLTEGPFLRFLAGRGLRSPGGEAISVIIKLALATQLMMHTSDLGINSSYYPIFYLPVMTAAMYFGPLGTLLWTLAAAGAYCSYLIPALRGEFTLTATGKGDLSLRIIFFFLLAMIVNRFVMVYRKQTFGYQMLAETLSVANQNLEKAQAEARRAERLAALGQLSAGLAHEIRNPLAVIKGSAELLSQKLTDSDAIAKELSGYIYTEVNRVSALVSRFLDFARPSRLELRPLPLAPVIERALKYLADQGHTSRLSVHCDFTAGLPQVMLDEELCEQVFINLLLNACQAMGEQGGELNIRTLEAESDGEPKVVAEVEDSGPGISLEMREQIFNPFVTTRKSGVGLGLAIVAKIVDAHGGDVRLVNGKGPGACFRVSFPRAEDLQPTT